MKFSPGVGKARKRAARHARKRVYGSRGQFLRRRVSIRGSSDQKAINFAAGVENLIHCYRP
jgi:hypothetical protein